MKGFLILWIVLTCLQTPAVAQSGPSMGMHWIMHEGRNIEVYGYVNGKGQIVWQPGIAENARPRERRDSPIEGPNKLPKAVVIPETLKPVIAPLKPSAAPSPDWVTNGAPLAHRPARSDTYTASTPEAAKFIAEVAGGKADPKLHVTVIGNADERARVTNDIKNDPAFASIRDDLQVQDYDAKDWPIDPKLGFVAGRPAIIVQAGKSPSDIKGGRVIFRCEDYSIGPTGLAEAIRKARPDYKPNLDPSPSNPGTDGLVFFTTGEAVPYVVAALVLALIVFLPKKEAV